jgi:hypothetical protein
MTRFVFEVDPMRLGQNLSEGDIPVLLYGATTEVPGAAIIGNDLRDKFERLSVPPSARAMDLVAVAMAVTAADTFAIREDEPDGWRRTLEVDLPVVEPDRWNTLASPLAEILGFLSGDTWSFTFRGGGRRPPTRLDVRARINSVDPSRSDCVALFSGGLDSALGVTDLIAAGRRPLLVSHAPRGDKIHQSTVAALLPAIMQRFDFNSYPTSNDIGATEITTRTRSFQFLAVAALAAEVINSFRGGSPIDLNICENGLIALNPPLTPRRIGSLSTRTAHPHYLTMMQQLLDALEMPVRIVNPHRHETKGEMLARHAGKAGIVDFASATVSCGNWKRKNKQCGRCWPCAIRRAAFLRAGLTDQSDYVTPHMIDALKDDEYRDDIVSIHTALKRRYERDLKLWVLQAGPLPDDAAERAGYFGAVERGMDELEVLFDQHGFKT